MSRASPLYSLECFYSNCSTVCPTLCIHTQHHQHAQQVVACTHRETRPVHVAKAKVVVCRSGDARKTLAYFPTTRARFRVNINPYGVPCRSAAGLLDRVTELPFTVRLISSRRGSAWVLGRIGKVLEGVSALPSPDLSTNPPPRPKTDHTLHFSDPKTCASRQ